MFLYFDRKGILKEIINDGALRQGNYGVNKLYVYCERTDITRLGVGYLLPSGLVVGPMNYDETETMEIPFDKKRDLRFFRYHEDYTFFVVDLEADENDHSPLDECGLVHCSIEAMLADTNIIQFGDVNFNVEENAVLNQHYVAQQEYMSLADYQYLKHLITLSDFENYVPLYNIVASAWDTEPTQNSIKPCTSGGIYNYLEHNYYDNRDTAALFVQKMYSDNGIIHEIKYLPGSITLTYTNENTDEVTSLEINGQGINVGSGRFVIDDNGIHVSENITIDGQTVAVKRDIKTYYQHHIVLRDETILLTINFLSQDRTAFDKRAFENIIGRMAERDGTVVLNAHGYDKIHGYDIYQIRIDDHNTCDLLVYDDTIQRPDFVAYDYTQFWQTCSISDYVVY